MTNMEAIAIRQARLTAKQFVGRPVSDTLMRHFFDAEKCSHRADIWPIYRDAFREEWTRATQCEAGPELYKALQLVADCKGDMNASGWTFVAAALALADGRHDANTCQDCTGDTKCSKAGPEIAGRLDTTREVEHEKEREEAKRLAEAIRSRATIEINRADAERLAALVLDRGLA